MIESLSLSLGRRRTRQSAPCWLLRACERDELATLHGLSPKAKHQHIDAAVVGFRATPHNGVTELVTRQYPARTVYEGGQQRGLGAGQPHFPAVAIDKGMAGQVELAVPDFYRRWDSFIALAPWRRAEPIEQLLFVQ